MKPAILLLTAAALAAAGCQSKTQNVAPSETGSWGKVIPTPAVIPEDWPISREEYYLLTSDSQNRALDPQELQRAGLHSRKEIVDFAHRVLQMDLAPVARDMTSNINYLVPLGAYTLLGYYGSLEDAAAQFEAVKAIDGKAVAEGRTPESRKFEPMVETLGYYLMRDHLMPQKDRRLMVEIEDYLYRCSELNAPPCWPYEGMETSNDELRINAFDAVAYGCSDRAKTRAKKYTAQNEGSIYYAFGEDALKDMARIESMRDKLLKQLPPVLPESESER